MKSFGIGTLLYTRDLNPKVDQPSEVYPMVFDGLLFLQRRGTFFPIINIFMPFDYRPAIVVKTRIGLGTCWYKSS